MRVNTKQLRQAEKEMQRQAELIKSVLLEVAEIQQKIYVYNSLEGAAQALRKWSKEMETDRKVQLCVTMALDTITRIYEESERRIIDVTDSAQVLRNGERLGCVETSSFICTLGLCVKRKAEEM